MVVELSVGGIKAEIELSVLVIEFGDEELAKDELEDGSILKIVEEAVLLVQGTSDIINQLDDGLVQS